MLIKDFANATPLMSKITTPKLHQQLGRAKEGARSRAALAAPSSTYSSLSFA